MQITFYDYTDQLNALAARAAKAWNRALKSEVLRKGPLLWSTSLRIEFAAVDRSKNFSRVAQFKGVRGVGIITLASDIRWRTTPWQRFWGLGQEDALAALLHEFGHALGLPHSDIYSDVMHPELGSTVISADEAARARAFLKL